MKTFMWALAFFGMGFPLVIASEYVPIAGLIGLGCWGITLLIAIGAFIDAMLWEYR